MGAAHTSPASHASPASNDAIAIATQCGTTEFAHKLLPRGRFEKKVQIPKVDPAGTAEASHASPVLSDALAEASHVTPAVGSLEHAMIFNQTHAGLDPMLQAGFAAAARLGLAVEFHELVKQLLIQRS
eukprot:4919491-Karenia_brevis.AAC.1